MFVTAETAYFIVKCAGNSRIVTYLRATAILRHLIFGWGGVVCDFEFWKLI